MLREQRLRKGVGHLEDPAVGAPVARQRIGLGRRPVGAQELLGEPEDVGDRRPAPAVDGLVGVADRHDRMSTAEEPVQHLCLCDRGVLVLVEEHHPVRRPLEVADDGLLLHQPGRHGDLVGEVHQPQRALSRR